ncbi:putative transporter YutK isoform X2 [Arctopsyche grandis]|uniref:putative transporter YutK isoform X2 n=1 Tax=Arctopsyche grandis TaxID=121162 RepID=UPI00406D7D87
MDNPGFTDAEIQKPTNQDENGLHHRKSLKNGNLEAIEMEEMEELEEENAIFKKINSMSKETKQFFSKRKLMVRYAAFGLLNALVFAYFFAALNYWFTYNRNKWEFCDGFGMLLILMSLVYFFLVYFIIVKPFFGKAIYRLVLKPIDNIYLKLWSIWICRWVFYLILVAALVVFLVIDTAGSRERLKSLIGLAVLLLLGFIFSKSPTKVIWRPVVWGVALQFIMGLITIRWSVGRDIFQCIGDKVSTFLMYSNDGSAFVFSDFLVLEKGVFAFQVLPVIFFFSLMIEIMFHWGVMQWVCLKLGWCLQVTMGTTVCESIISAANTFLGMSESPLLIRPYIPDLTNSEIHSIMASGFATVSGTVLAAYISFGVEPAHLITASVMSAPASLCFSKLFFPETEKSKTSVDNIQMSKSDNSSALDAAAKGASAAISLVLNIAANLIAFVSLVAFLNGVLNWLGVLIGWDFLTFEWIFGKIFIPLSWVMGVPWEECDSVGTLIGLKTVVNEFVAYERLGKFKEQGLLSPRGEGIATYALCGFTNPSSVGIMVGALSAMAPNRRSDIANVAVRGFFAGCAVCFMTACIAGLLMDPSDYEMSSNSTKIATTIATTITTTLA